MKKPKSYLNEVARLNSALIAGWDAHLAAIHAAPVAALPAAANRATAH
jgi:hypothetical protein